MCEGVCFFGRVSVDDITQADDSGEMFCGQSDGFPESFFEGILAYIELFCEAIDGFGAFCRLKCFYGLPDEGVGGCSYFGAEVLLDEGCSLGVGGHV